jgi:hypothetical protein
MEENSPGDHRGLFTIWKGKYRRDRLAPHDVPAVMTKDGCANITTALPIFRSALSSFKSRQLDNFQDDAR